MEKISCEVIKDLLPLYVDDVLSEDSRKLVESHISDCADCKKYYEDMQNSSFMLTTQKSSDGKVVIKKIRRNINNKKLVLICITAVVVASIALCSFYSIVLKESYLPYEDTGLYVEGNELYTKEPYFCYYGFDTPEDGTMFIYLTNTFYGSHQEVQKKIMVDKFISTENDEIKQVYYVPQEYVEFLSNGDWVSANNEADYIENNQENLTEIKENSTLIWEAE